MALKLSYFGDEFIIIPESFDHQNSCYSCSTDVFGKNSIEIPFNLDIDSIYTKDDFLIFLYTKKDSHENDIFEIYDRISNVRIGWCFTIQALDSVEHSFSSNEHFLRYAYIAFQLLIEKDYEGSYLNVPQIESSGKIKLSDFYSSNTVVFILSKNQIEGIDGFDFSNYNSSLFYYGFFPLIDRNPDNLVYSGIDSNSNRLLLNKISEEIKDIPFINSIYSEQLAYEINPIFQFFFLYQVVELFLEEIYINEQKEYINRLIRNAENSVIVKDILSKINKITSEKKRLGKLTGSYVTKMPDQNGLKDSCNRFLSRYGLEGGNNISVYLYNVRNFLFHQFRNYDFNQNELLKDIVFFLGPFLCNLMECYKIPNN